MFQFYLKKVTKGTRSWRFPARTLGAFFYAIGGLIALFAAFNLTVYPLLASGPDSNRILAYQIRLTDSTGTAVATGTYNLKLSFYTASSGGSPVHTDCGTTGTPVARKAVVGSNGIATVLIGDTAASGTTNCSDGSAPNALPATLFNNTSLYLGVTVGADTEMTPRKRLGSQGWSLNADKLDDLETSSVGGSAAFVPVTDSSGHLTLTKNLTVDTNTFFVDSSGDIVGIGTTSPAAGNKLVVAGKIKSTTGGIEFPDGTIMTSATATSAGLTNNGSIVMGSDQDNLAGGDTIFQTSTVERARITATTGRFGIGSSSPTQLLSVGSTNLFTVDDSGNVIAVTVQSGDGTAAAPGITFSADADNGLFRPAINTLGFASGGSERMRLDSSGNLGLGITVPATIFDMNGAFSMREMSAPADAPLDQGRIYFDATTNKFRVSENGGVYTDLVAGAGASGWNDSGSIVRTTTDGDTVGIGENPGAGVKFQVAGKIKSSTGGYEFPDGTVMTTAATTSSGVSSASDVNVAADNDNSTSGAIIFSTAIQERMRIVNGGSVGIGTATPTTLFSVGSGSPFTVDGSGNIVGARIRINDGAVGTPGFAFSSDTSTGFFRPGAGIIAFSSGGTERARFSGANFGIGTAAPSSPLSVGAANQFQVNASGTVSTTSTISGTTILVDAGTASTPTHTFTGNTNLGMYRAALDTLAFTTGGAERVRITSGGGVNIGNTSGTEQFTVGTAAQFAVTTAGNLSKINNVAFSWPSSQGAASTVLTNDGAGNLSWNTPLSGSGTASGRVAFWSGDLTLSNSSSLFWDNTNARLGIGTTAPGTSFEISNTAPHVTLRGDGTLDSNGIVRGQRSAGLIAAPTAVSGSTTLLTLLGMGHNGTSFVNGPQIDLLTTETWSLTAQGSAMTFTTVANGATTQSERMRIDQNGFVGIGTTTPTTILDVNGALNVREMAAPAVSTADQGRIYFDSTANKFKVSENGGAYQDLIATGAAAGWTDNGTVVRLTTDGDTVGIGEDPGVGVKLQVAGKIKSSSAGFEFPDGTVQTTAAATATGATSTTDVNLSADTDNNSTGAIIFSTVSTERARFTNGGNFGIGTSTPTQKLSVGATSQFTVDASGNIVGNAIDVAAGSAASPAYAFTNVGGSDDGFFWAANDIIGWSTAGGERMRLDGSGRLGIGDSSPTALLTVGSTDGFKVDNSGNVTVAGLLTSGTHRTSAGSAATPGFAFTNAGGSDDGFFWAANDIIGWSTAGGERMRLDGSGRLGIGDSSPTALLTVGSTDGFKVDNSGNVTVAGLLTSGTHRTSAGSAATPGFAFTNTGGTDDGFFWVANDIIGWSTAGGERMRLDGSGRLGVGSASPSQLLSVGSTNAFTVDGSGNVTHSGLLTSGTHRTSAGSAATPGFAFTNTGGTDDGFFWVANDIIGWSTAGGERMRLDGSGRLGIGDTTPSALLTVGASDGFTVDGSGNVTLSGLLTSGTHRTSAGSAATPGFAFTNAGGSDDGFFWAANDIIGWSTAGGERMRLDGSGRLGIGDTTPAALLTVGNLDTTQIDGSGNITNTGTTSSNILRGAAGSAATPSHAFNSTGGSDDGMFAVTNDIIAWSTAGGERMRLDGSGRLGIGDTTPSALLTVGTADQFTVDGSSNVTMTTSGSVMNFASAADNTYIWRLPQNGATKGACESGGIEGLIIQNSAGSQVGHMCIANTTTQLSWFAQSFNATSTDLAENYGTDPADDIQEGDVVVLDTRVAAKKVVKAETAYATALGVISTAPGLLLSGIDEASGQSEVDNPKPVALAGRVPVKVSVQNGPIGVGDPIAASVIPGVGMKATQSGMIIGYALEPFDGSDTGKILVFMRVGWVSIETSLAGETSSALSENLDLKGHAILNITSLAAANGSWSIDENGRLTAKEVVADKVQSKEFSVETTDQYQSSGEGTIITGRTSLVVDNPVMRANSRVFVTFFDRVDGGWWISRREDGRFEVTLTQPAMNEIRFEYLIVTVNDRRTPPAPPQPTVETPAEPPLEVAPTPQEVAAAEPVLEEPLPEPPAPEPVAVPPEAEPTAEPVPAETAPPIDEPAQP